MAKEKILIIDEENNARSMLALELENAGYQVFQADDGEAGYQIVRGVKPDLIISDILSPPMDGNRLLKKLRESEFTKKIAFVILTARSQMQDYFEMMEVDDFITKPFEAEDLLARVGRVLEKARKRKLATASDADKPGGKKRVLILEDDKDTYEKFEKILAENGYEVSVVKTVPECLDSSVIFKPSVVAMKFILEGENGDKLVAVMKDMPYMRDVPFVVYSHKIRGWEEKSVLKAGAACFVGEVTEKKFLEAVKKIAG